MKSLLDNNPIIWQDYNSNSLLDENSTHVFKIPINVYNKISAQYPTVLEAHEIDKAARFKKTDDTKRYVIGKFFLRMVLSDMLRISPSAITLSYTKKRSHTLTALILI